MKLRTQALSLILVMGLVLPQGLAFAATAPVASTTQPAQTVTTNAPSISSTSNLVTLDAAIDAAIKNNLDLHLSELEKTKRKNDMERAILNLNDAGRSNTNNALYSATDAITNLKNSDSSSEENNTYNKALIKDSVTNLFLAVRKAELQLSALDAQVISDDAQLESDRVKARIGLISKYTLELNYSGYLKNRQSRDSQALALDKTRVSLKNLMGADVQKPLLLDNSFTTKYTLETPNYDAGLKRMQSSSLYFSMANSSLKIAQDNLSTLTTRYPENTRSNSETTTIKNATDSVTKIKLDIDNKTTNGRYVYTTAHAAVVDAMDNYRQKQKDYVVAQKNYSNGGIRYKQGLISKVAYKAYEAQLKAADSDQQSAWLDYVAARVSLESVIIGTKTQ